MKDVLIKITLCIAFLILFLVYYTTSFASEVDTVFLTISAFLFAIFAGFFITRQGSRYSEIREKISNFDGNLSSIYRFFGHFQSGAQERAGEIIKAHCKVILSSGEWDYHFIHKSNTLTALHKELKDSLDSSVTNAVANGVTKPLQDNQLLRKNIIALRYERVPFFKWMIIYTLSILLLITVSTIPSEGLILNSALKATFVVIILMISILLRQLDRLELFDRAFEKDSAQDVINTIEGRK